MIDYKTAKGWLREDERDGLKQAASLVPPNGYIINIGVEYGASIACFRAGNPTCSILGIDINLSTLVTETYLECKPLLLEGDSSSIEMQDDATQWVRWNDNQCVDLLFVDGDHNYDGVLKDANYYCGLVCKGGVVIFHDCFDWDHIDQIACHPWVARVNEAVEDWLKVNHDNWVELPHCGTMRSFKRL